MGRRLGRRCTRRWLPRCRWRLLRYRSRNLPALFRGLRRSLRLRDHLIRHRICVRPLHYFHDHSPAHGARGHQQKNVQRLHLK